MSGLAASLRPLGGHGGPQCTAQGLGAASFGDRFELLPNEEALAAVEMAWQQGLRFFDTAPWCLLRSSSSSSSSSSVTHVHGQFGLDCLTALLLTL